MTRRLAWLFGALVAAAPLAAQGTAPTVVRTGVQIDAYSFGSGLAFDRITEITLPISVVHQFGPRLSVDLSSAFASASVRTSGGSTLSRSGLLDTDLRAVYSAIPSRLMVTFVATLPTGKTEVPDSVMPLFGALATDLFGFSAPSFGGGGALTGGVSSAFRVGDSWALGAAASYRYTLNYKPISGAGQLKPGDEARLRVGLEGPLGAGRYLRTAAVFTASGSDTLADSTGNRSITGDRMLAYAAVSMPLGRSSLSLYVFDMYRMRPRGFFTTYQSAIKVPRGNVFALGARLDRSLSPTMTLSPALELRHEMVGSGDTFIPLGLLVRAGSDLRWRVGPSATVVFQGHLAFGKLNDQGTRVSVFGPRVGALLEWTR